MRRLPAVIVHGGAWAIPDHLHAASRQGAAAAARAAYKVMSQGGSALDGVEAAVVELENCPVFDAGIGSVLNEDGEVEMDACIMDGKALRAGGVAAVKNIQNPVSLARKVMEETDHCLLVGQGANKFAARCGIPTVPTEVLVTPEAMEQHRSISEYKPGVDDLFRRQAAHDTVGAVAMDSCGNLAAATSTGGITAKMAGRVGDSPLIGAGCYADNTLGGVSTTGHGESIIKVLLAHRVSLAMGNDSSAARAAYMELQNMYERVGGCGGAIAINSEGIPGMWHTTEWMPWAVARPSMPSGRVTVTEFCEDIGNGGEVMWGMGHSDGPAGMVTAPV